MPFALKAANLNKALVEKCGLREVNNLAYQIDMLRHELRLKAPSLIVVQKGAEIIEHPSDSKVVDKAVVEIEPEDPDQITYSQKSDMLIKFGGL